MAIQKQKLLVPGYLTNRIYPLLLQKDGQQVSFGIKVDNVYSLMAEEDAGDLSDYERVFMIHELFKGYKEHSQVFKDVLDNADFIVQLLSFYEECVFFEVGLAGLPKDNEEEKELAELLGLIDQVGEDIRNDHRSFLEKGKGYAVLNDLYGSFSEYELMQKYVGQGAETFALLPERKPQLLLKKTTTRGHELASAAEYIIKNAGKKIQVIAPDDIYMEDIARIFKSYAIPYRRISYRSSSAIIDRLLIFLSFLISKDADDLLPVLQQEERYRPLYEYGRLFRPQLQDYLNRFDRLADIDIQAIRETRKALYGEKDETKKKELQTRLAELAVSPLFDLSSDRQLGDLADLEKKAEKVRMLNEDKIRSWIEADPYASLLDYYNDMCDTLDWKRHRNDLQVFSKAGLTIVEAQRHQGDLQILRDLLAGFKVKDEKGNGNEILVTDMDHLLPDRDITIVVGASEGDFLPSIEKKGIIKEDYLVKVKGYPSLNERLSFCKLKLEALRKISGILYVSYCFSNYEGKEKRLSNYIEDAFGVREEDFEEIEGAKHNYQKKIGKTVSAEHARRLFIEEDQGIAGSVSSLEGYCKCPYSYFLRRGLNISDLQGYQRIDAALLGNMRHKIFELSVKEELASREEMQELLDTYIDALEEVYRAEKLELEFNREAIGEILELNRFIETELRKEGMKAAAQEFRLDKEYVQAGDHHFDFTAIVDRIDEGQGNFRVIDYKSSSTKLNLSEFVEGRQLQLLTYLWLLWKKNVLHKEPLGAFYFDLDAKNGKPTQKLADLLAGFADEEKLKDFFLNNNKLQGWYVNDDKDSRSRLISVAQKRIGDEFKEKYPLETMEGIDSFLSDLYQAIADNIAAGNIMTMPSDDNCRFCIYRPICHKEKPEKTEDEDDSEE